MCSQTCRKLTALGLVALVVGLFVAAAILTGYSVDMTEFNIKESSWNSVTGLLIFIAVYLSVCLLFAFIAIIWQGKIMLAIFIIFWTICTMFTIGVGVLVLAFGSIEYDSTKSGCTSHENGVVSLFEEVDTIYEKVNDLVCSENCPCDFSNRAVYAAYISTAEEQTFWTHTAGTAKNVEECSESSLKDMWTALGEANENIKDFNQGVVYDFFRKIEQKFECTGWCKRSYLKEITFGDLSKVTRTRKFVRYLFANLNYEPVAGSNNSGCMKEAFDYIGPLCVAYGAVAIFAFGAMVAVLILAITLCCKQEEEEKK